MSSAVDGGANPAGLEALHRLKSTEPPHYLTPSPELSKAARSASEYLFASLSPYTPKNPLNKLWTDGFDAEQIWQQIDLQAQPLLSSLRRQVRNFEKNPSEIEKQFNLDGDVGKEEHLKENGKIKEKYDDESESEDFDDVDDEEDEDEDEEGEEEGDEDEDEDEDEDDEEIENDEGENPKGVEDEFLKLKELEEYLKDDEAREYGLKKEKKNKRKRSKIADDDENEEGDEEEEDEDDELGLMGLEDDDGSDMENARFAIILALIQVAECVHSLTRGYLMLLCPSSPWRLVAIVLVT